MQDFGYAGLSFRELAKAVGIKSASIHYYFATKSELGAAIVSRYTAFHAAILETLLVDGLDPQTCLTRYAERATAREHRSAVNRRQAAARTASMAT